MLSRTADHLYWMARYTERAENIARMVEVNSRMSLLPQTSEEVVQAWTATLTIIGLWEAYQAKYPLISPSNAIAFMV
ncbi:MAG: alpha-E domain-containing protein, partial [Steroidobacteraceae bacterium]